MVMPICQHPINKNGIIVYDLHVHPEEFFNADVEEMAARLYTPVADLPEGVSRIPLKQIHINKCPVVVPLKTMDHQTADRLDIDVDTCMKHREFILQHIDTFASSTASIFQQNEYPEINDPDAMLYSGGFFSRDDSQRIEEIRQKQANELASTHMIFDDDRLDEMLFRYRARNWPDTLDNNELEKWNHYRHDRFNDPAKSHRTMNQFLATIESLRQGPDITGSQLAILDELAAYARSIKI
jgi:exodeoxyribonuclease-1